MLTAVLARQGHSPAHVSAALHSLRSEALLHGRTLYAANQAVYQLLRYGIPVKVAAGGLNETVHLGWDQPADNDFAVAEEVTQLHARFWLRPAQHRPGQEAARVPRVHRGA